MFTYSTKLLKIAALISLAIFGVMCIPVPVLEVLKGLPQLIMGLVAISILGVSLLPLTIAFEIQDNVLYYRKSNSWSNFRKRRAGEMIFPFEVVNGVKLKGNKLVLLTKRGKFELSAFGLSKVKKQELLHRVYEQVVFHSQHRVEGLEVKKQKSNGWGALPSTEILRTSTFASELS